MVNEDVKRSIDAIAWLAQEFIANEKTDYINTGGRYNYYWRNTSDAEDQEFNLRQYGFNNRYVAIACDKSANRVFYYVWEDE